MQLVGTQNTHELVTISLDGVICWWSLDNLHTPIEKISALKGAKKNVIFFSNNNNFKIILSCHFLQFHSITMMYQSLFAVAKMDACIWVIEVNQLKKRKFMLTLMVWLIFGLNKFIKFSAHYGAVTNVELHKTPGSADFSRYCLTSSIDFTCKLWNLAVIF